MFIVPAKMTTGNAWALNSHGENLSEVARVLVLIGRLPAHSELQ